MSGKFKHTSQRVLAKQVMEMIDWQLQYSEQLECGGQIETSNDLPWGDQLERDQEERSEHQKMVDEMLGSLAQNMGKTPTSRALNTVEVTRFRADALRAQAAQTVSGTSKSGICSSFKRLNLQRS